MPSSTRSPTQPGLAETAGLRITADRTPEPAFEVSAAQQAEPGDQVVEQGGATVYLDPPPPQLLDDKVLDAAVDPSRQGRVRPRAPGLTRTGLVAAPALGTGPAGTDTGARPRRRATLRFGRIEP